MSLTKRYFRLIKTKTFVCFYKKKKKKRVYKEVFLEYLEFSFFFFFLEYFENRS